MELIDEIFVTLTSSQKPATLYSALQQEAFEEAIESGDRENVLQLFNHIYYISYIMIKVQYQPIKIY